MQRDLIAMFGLGMPGPALGGPTDGLLLLRRPAGRCRARAPRSSPTARRSSALKAARAPRATRFDRELWAELAEAGLLGIALPERRGGGGLGFLELCLVLEEVGRTVAPVPALAVHGARRRPRSAEFGAHRRSSTASAAGDAHRHRRADRGARRRATRRPPPADGDGRLTGDEGRACPPGIVADARSSSSGDRRRRSSSTRRRRASTVERQDTTLGAARRARRARAAPAADQARPAPRALAWLLERATTAHVRVMMSASANEAARPHRRVHEEPRAVRPADRHVPGGRPAGRRRLHRHRGDPAHHVAGGVAPRRRRARRRRRSPSRSSGRATAGSGVVHAAQHLHGGIGVDRDYPLHRYFLLAKQLELDLGSATPTLMHLGALIADTPVGLTRSASGSRWQVSCWRSSSRRVRGCGGTTCPTGTSGSGRCTSSRRSRCWSSRSRWS